MQIDETAFPVEPAWEGTLAPTRDLSTLIVTTCKDTWDIYWSVVWGCCCGMLLLPLPPGEKLPTVSIGRPVWWDDEAILGEKWTPPVGENRYGLARFAFSLRPEERKVVRRAELMVSFEAENGGGDPVVFDLLPKVAAEDKTGTFKATVGLDFKFLSLAKAETTIDLYQKVPVIVADGIGESIARWVFTFDPAHPIRGSQIVFAILEMPAGTSAARASLHLSAEVATSLGPIRGILPKEASEHLSWTLR